MRRAAAGLLVLALACGGPAPDTPSGTETPPVAVALEMLRDARTEEGRVRLAAERFGIDVDDADWPPLLDALERVGRFSDPRPGEPERLDAGGDLAEWVVDLDVALAEVGRGDVSVRLRHADDSWTIDAFHGPGAEWPPRDRPRDDGLTSSAPPDATE